MRLTERIRAWAESNSTYDPDLSELPEAFMAASEAEIMALLGSDPSFTLLQVVLAIADGALVQDEAIAGVLRYGISTGNPSVMGEYYRQLGLRVSPDAHLAVVRAAFERDRSAGSGAMYWLFPLFTGHFPDRLADLQAFADESARG